MAVLSDGMKRDFFDPTPEEHRSFSLRPPVQRKAEKQIESCEHCNSEGAEIPFDIFLTELPARVPA
jgi:hypothetical protein